MLIDMGGSGDVGDEVKRVGLGFFLMYIIINTLFIKNT